MPNDSHGVYEVVRYNKILAARCKIDVGQFKLIVGRFIVSRTAAIQCSRSNARIMSIFNLLSTLYGR